MKGREEVHYVRLDDIPEWQERGWKLVDGPNLEGTPHGVYSRMMVRDIPAPTLFFLSSGNAGEVYLNVDSERYLLTKGQVENFARKALHEVLRWPS